MGDKASGAQLLERGISILDELARAGEAGMRLIELAERTGLTSSTAHRILSTFERRGWVAREQATRRYRLGVQLFSLGASAADGTGLRRHCRPALRQIAEETEETVFLMVRGGDEAVCVDRQEGGYVVATPMQYVGAAHPLGVGVGSIAILGALDSDEAELILERNERYYSGFGLSAEVVRRRVAQARDMGYAMRDGEEIEGLSAIATAICPPGRDVAAALSINLMSARLRPERLPQLVQILSRECRQIEEHLAYRGRSRKAAGKVQAVT